MNLKDMLRGDDLVISLRHEAWLENNSNPIYSDKAIEFANNVLSQQVGGGRSRTSKFRASGLGSCERKQVYQAEGVKQADTINARLSNIFATGNFLHLKWQMMGLTEGWLKEAEVPSESEEFSFGGTLDGILYDNSLFEFKSINPRGFSRVYEYGPQKDHIKQATGYMWLKGLDAVSFVYENKGDQEWREFRVQRDEKIVDEIIASLDRMENHLQEKTRPRREVKCLQKQGYLYRYCPFKDICIE